MGDLKRAAQKPQDRNQTRAAYSLTLVAASYTEAMYRTGRRKVGRPFKPRRALEKIVPTAKTIVVDVAQCRGRYFFGVIQL